MLNRQWLLHLPTIEEADGTVGQFGLRLIVCYHYDGTPVLLV